MDEDDSRSGLSDSGRSQDPNKRNVLKAFEATEAEQRAYQERLNAKFGQKNAGSEKLVKIDEEDDDRSGLSDSGRSQDPNKYNVLKAFEATDAEQNEHQDRLNAMFGQRNAQSAKQGKMNDEAYNQSIRSGLLDSGRSQDPSKQNVLNAFATTDAEQNEHQKRLNAMFGQRTAQSAKPGKMNDEAYNESMRSGLLDSGKSQDPNKQNVLNAFATTDAEQSEHQQRLNAMFGQKNAQSVKQDNESDRSRFDSGKSQEPNKDRVLSAFAKTDAEQDEFKNKLAEMFAKQT